ncbi:uncharacterized protein JCM15063_003198 [Sporobolomyces koalae]|uniref:uncharacterized protein n=1 Tax=Sporobolomyces koalae TaxID=500713 RepID=UPI00317D5D6B
MSQGYESWDADPDFLLPPEGLSLPPHDRTAESADVFSLLDSKLHEPREELVGGETRDEKQDSWNSFKSTTSTISSTGTVRQEDTTFTCDDSRSTQPDPAPVPTEPKFQTIRLGSDLSRLLARTNPLPTARAEATRHLAGKIPQQSVKVHVEDSHQDLASNDFAFGVPPRAEDPEVAASDDPPRIRARISIDSFREDPSESDEVSDLDFDLPSTRSTFDLAPSLALPHTQPETPEIETLLPEQRAREVTSRSASVTDASISSTSVLNVASQRLSILSAYSSATTTTTDDDDSDAEFFSGLVLPAYFLGRSTNDPVNEGQRRRGGTTTPATSEGEMDHCASSLYSSETSPIKPSAELESDAAQVDLQSLLQEKLRIRGGRGIMVRTTSGTKEQLEGLEKHREKDEDVHEAGTELSLSQNLSERLETQDETKHEDENDLGWNAQAMRDRMRTISGARAKEAASARQSRMAAGAVRRTASMGGAHPSISSSSAASLARTGGRPGVARRSDTAPTQIGELDRRTHLVRIGSSARTAAPQPSKIQRTSSRSSLPQLATRPASAQSSHSSTTSSSTTKRGFPHAPSTSSRDRFRPRTTSLSTLKSNFQPPSVPLRTMRQPSETPVTSAPTHPPRMASAPGPLETLRSKRSQQYLRPARAASVDHPIERKRSLQNLSSIAHLPQGRPSFAAPTAASSSRVRERVNSNPPPPSTSSEVVRNASRAPSRLHQATLSSASKSRSFTNLAQIPSRSSSLRIPSRPVHLSRPITSPLRDREGTDQYGDGTELDVFDDLPVSHEREQAIVAQPKGTKTRPNFVKAESSVASSRGDARQLQHMKLKLLSRDASITGVSNEKNAPTKKRREPRLIRHLGGSDTAPKVQGEMTYNPKSHRWEGNENVLVEFDRALSNTTRPALISPFSSTSNGSPSQKSFTAPLDTSPDSAPVQAFEGGSRGGVKVVGEMVFDPSTCSWHAISGPEAEEELELDWGEVADDEHAGERDGWEKGEQERMLKSRASFVLSEGEDGSSNEEDQGANRKRGGKMTRQGIFRESKRAEERCRKEMKGWITVARQDELEDRSWLYELRALVVHSK